MGLHRPTCIFLAKNNSRLEPCADVIVSAAARRSILVGGGSPQPVLKIGGGAASAAKKCFSKVPEKIFLSSKFSNNLF